MKSFQLKYLRAAVLVLSLMFLSCTDSEDGYKWNDDWEQTEDPDKGDNGDEGNQEVETPDIPKSRYVWIDAAANLPDYGNDEAKIADDLARIKRVGFTDIIVDVRPTTGDILFNSSVGSPLERIDVWGTSYYWFKRTSEFDYLQAFIDAARSLGLGVHASINTFVGGYLCPYGLGSEGMLFDDPSKKDWATVINSEDGLVNTMDMLDDGVDWGAKFLNPADPEVQDYILQLLADLAAYDLDGIILDRCRYSDDGLLADFSQESRSQFEQYVGKKVGNWPSDIMTPGATSMTNTADQLKWLEFRAKTIHDFIVKASDKVHSVNQDIRFGVYVGGWYGSYYPSGVNWAHPSYDPSKSYPWASAKYKDYGYADHCDYMFIGAYAGADSIWGNTEWTVQGFCKTAGEKLGKTPFCGGPDIGNGTGFTDGGKGALMTELIDACINASTEGMFVFDLCHIKKFDYWDDFKAGFDKYLADFE